MKWNIVVKQHPEKSNAFAFFINAECGVRQIGLLEFPNDGQITDNYEACVGIVDILKKRVHKSM